MDVGAMVGPDTFLSGDREPPQKQPILPLALATSLAFDTTAWLELQISSATPAFDLSQMLRRGTYKLELFQLIILSRRSGVSLKKFVEAREKGKSLRSLAEEHQTDYDWVYDESLEMEKRIESFYPRILTVAAGAPAESASAPYVPKARVPTPAAPPPRKKSGPQPASPEGLPGMKPEDVP
ncbi:MAG: hypothetical protein HY551_05825 [Elusimicrobia bacterium]|nr:hypothetical protein [Elusimicrobiota bacterium]